MLGTISCRVSCDCGIRIDCDDMAGEVRLSTDSDCGGKCFFATSVCADSNATNRHRTQYSNPNGDSCCDVCCCYNDGRNCAPDYQRDYTII